MVVDDFKPICFETEVEFHNREETIVPLRYECLFEFYQKCYNLCHDQSMCTSRGGTKEDKEAVFSDETRQKFKHNELLRSNY